MFEIGDFVRINKPDCPDETFAGWVDEMDKFDGAIRKITEIGGHEDYDVKLVSFEDVPKYMFESSWLELVRKSNDPKFEVGDLVIIHKPAINFSIVKWNDESMDRYDGLLSEITSIHKVDESLSRGRDVWTARFDDDTGLYVFDTRWLELVSPVGSPDIELGDEDLVAFIRGFGGDTA